MLLRQRQWPGGSGHRKPRHGMDQCIRDTSEHSLPTRALRQTDWWTLFYHLFLKPDTSIHRSLARGTGSLWLSQSHQGGLLQEKSSGPVFRTRLSQPATADKRNQTYPCQARQTTLVMTLTAFLDDLVFTKQNLGLQSFLARSYLNSSLRWWPSLVLGFIFHNNISTVKYAKTVFFCFSEKKG